MNNNWNLARVNFTSWVKTIARKVTAAAAKVSARQGTTVRPNTTRSQTVQQQLRRGFAKKPSWALSARWGTVVVCVLIGVLLVSSTRLVRYQQGQPLRGGLIDAYRYEQDQLQIANDKARLLRVQVQQQAEQLAEKTTPGSNDQQPHDDRHLLQAAGLTPVEGAALTVVLNDAPTGSYERLGNQGKPDDFVVHQQDIQAVVNALWAGGAQAMMIQDSHRVISTTAVRCVGSLLLVQDRSYPPPYKITAIGPIEGMQVALDQSPSVTVYRQYVQLFGLEYTVSTEPHVSMPAYEGSTGILKAVAVSTS